MKPKWKNCRGNWWEVIPKGCVIQAKNLNDGHVTFLHPITNVKYRVDLWDDEVRKLEPQQEEQA